jgi:hypothetical protein
MKKWVSLLLLMFPLLVHAQAIMSVDRTEITIGDQVKATLSMDAALEKSWRNADGVWPDSIPGIEIISGPERNSSGANLAATWTLAFFDTGYVMIPAVPVVIQGATDTLFTNRIPIHVKAVEPDSTGLIDIRDIYHHPFDPSYYIRYIPIALVILLGIIVLWYWWKRRTKAVPPAVQEIHLEPHEWAFKALQELADRKLWQHGEVKEHYTLLTAILREYLERRFAIHALEQTSDEILQQLHQRQLSRTLLADTEELLSIADLIKFAKADPGMDVHAVTIERVRRFIKETMPAAATIEPSKSENQDVDG